MFIPKTEVKMSKDGDVIGQHTLAPGDYVFGRTADADIQIDTDRVSRAHARLTINFDEWLIEDLGSSNGTFINNRRLAAHAVTKIFPTQVLRIGDVTITLRRLRESESPDVSLPPNLAAVRTLLPEEIRKEQRYAIGQVVASGGMGAILDARDQTIDRTVAMKVMLGAGSSDDIVRFVEEAKITGQLTHPNIVPIYELGVDEHDQPFYTMKLVEGFTLKSVLQKLAAGDADTLAKFPLRRLIQLLLRACDAVAFAHSRGVIHRDLKPENIMLGEFGEVLVMDWGLAKVLGKPESHSGGRVERVVTSIRGEDGTQTLAGSVMGTPAYMAPEQAVGEIEKIDARTDVYALGAILYEILVLRQPVSGESIEEILEKVRSGSINDPRKLTQRTQPKAAADGAKTRPPLERRVNIPDSLAAVAMKALSHDQEKRYENVGLFKAELDAWLGGFATRAESAGVFKQLALLIGRHKGIFGTAVAAWVLIIALGAWFIVKVTHERNRAEQALIDLKKQAPGLRQLADSEATFQRFDSALEKLDAALTLDPDHLPSYWRRAWLLIGMNRLPEAATAIRLAKEKDPTHIELAAILPTIEQLAALSRNGTWPAESAQQLVKHLEKVGASGEIVALSGKLKLAAKERVNLVRKRLDEWLGQGKGRVSVDNSGLVTVDLKEIPADTIEPLRGMPLDILRANATDVTSLEPLRGMRLVGISVPRKVTDLSPLHGMPLRFVYVNGSRVIDLSPLRGAPLEDVSVSQTDIVDLSPLRGTPLRRVDASNAKISDLSFLTDSPIEKLYLKSARVSDLSPLRGKPLKDLNLSRTKVSDLSPLRGAPIESLDISFNPVKDLTPLLELPKLEKLRVSKWGKLLEPLRTHPSLKYIADDDDIYRPAAEFWADYDASNSATTK